MTCAHDAPPPQTAERAACVPHGRVFESEHERAARDQKLERDAAVHLVEPPPVTGQKHLVMVPMCSETIRLLEGFPGTQWREGRGWRRGWRGLRWWRAWRRRPVAVRRVSVRSVVMA